MTYSTRDKPVVPLSALAPAADTELATLRRFAEVMLDKVEQHPDIKQPRKGGILVEIAVGMTVGEIEILRMLVKREGLSK